MSDLNFISTYMPSFAEIPAEEVSDTRERLVNYIRQGFPEMDISPNTVVGDLVVTPMSFTVSALETGLDRFMSDLNLANVADDVIYNCDFVEAYLHNFNVTPAAQLQPSGVVRLVFSQNKDYYLDRSIRFSFNDAVFSVYYTQADKPFRIHKVGVHTAAGEDGATLKDSGSDAYFADIPVVGVTGEVNVPASTSGLINSLVYPELGAITALTDFDPGAVTRTIPQMAADTRKTIYAASLNTRNGAVQYITTTCPFVDGVYAITTGDSEMLRAYDPDNALVKKNCLDLYVRSKSYAFEEEQPIKLLLKERDNGTVYFEGAFDYVGQPYHITSVTHPNVELADIPHSIIARATADAPADVPLISYTAHELTTLRVEYGRYVLNGDIRTFKPNARLENLDGSISIDTHGQRYAVFSVRYKTDPMLHAVANTVTSADNRPVNMTVMARGFIPVIISKYEVKYVKRPGVQVLLDEARDRISEYLTGLGVPDVYSDGPVNKIMDEAGVKYVKGINVNARVQWSIADKMVKRDSGEELDIKKGPYINTSADLRVSYKDQSELPSQYACSVRNVRYYLLDGAVTFSEVKEV